MSLTYKDLKRAPEGAFLYCEECQQHYSAHPSDYFMEKADTVITCGGTCALGDLGGPPLILAREERKIVPVLLLPKGKLAAAKAQYGATPAVRRLRRKA